MRRFRFRAYDRNGQLVEGELEGASRSAVLSSLRERDAFPVDVEEASGQRKTPWWALEIGGSGGMPAAALELFTRELATLVSAHLPIDEALRILALQPLMPRRCRDVIDGLLSRVLNGESLAEAMTAYPRLFPDYYRKLVAAGERGGNLRGVLSALADFLKRGGAARQKIQSALIYPLVLLVAAVLALGIIMALLVPALEPVFADAGAEPPAIISALIGLRDSFAAHGTLYAAIALTAILVGMLIARQPAVRETTGRLLSRLPFIGGMIGRRETARFAGTLSMLLKGGVPLLDASRIAADTLSNARYRTAAKTAHTNLAKGEPLSRQLENSGAFGPLAVRLVAVGEQTGQLPEMLARLSEIEDKALERTLERATTLAGPVLTLLLGGFVGAVILSVMGAIVSLNDLALR